LFQPSFEHFVRDVPAASAARPRASTEETVFSDAVPLFLPRNELLE